MLRRIISRSMMVSVFGFVGFSALAGVDLKGTLQVTRPMQLKEVIRSSTLQPGNYNVSIEDHNVLHHLTLQVGSKSYKFGYSGTLPQTEGEATIYASSGKQQQDLNFKVHTNVTTGPQYTRVESCILDSYQVPVYNPYSPYPLYETRYIYGVHEVTRHNETADHYYTLTFSEQQSSSAVFTAATRDQSSPIDYSTPCR